MTHLSENKLADFLENALGPAEIALTRDHLESCPVCTAELERVEAVAMRRQPPGLQSRVLALGAGLRATAGAGSLPGVAGYEIVREVGRGGGGAVYEATHPRFGRVAIKLPLRGQILDEKYLARFRAESREAKRLSDLATVTPGRRLAVVHVYEAGESRGLPFLSMEFAVGGTLAERAADFRADPARAALLLARVVDALDAMHTLSPAAVHRDFKPENVLLQLRPGEPTDVNPRTLPLTAFDPLIADYGLTKQIDQPGDTQTKDLRGTPHFMAPELTRDGKAATPASDIYAVGATLYSLLSGRRPFEAANLPDLFYSIRRGHPTPPTKPGEPLPPLALQAVCLKCLAKRPTRRYHSAKALAADLRAFASGEPTAARFPGRFGRAWGRVARNPIPAASMAASIAIGVFAVAAASGAVLWGVARSAAAAARVARVEAEVAQAEAEGRAATEGKARAEERYRALFKLATARGDAWAILTAYPQARAEGVTLEQGILPDYLNAVAAVYGSDRVLEELDRLPADDIPVQDRGRLALWRASCLFGRNAAAATRALDEARAGPLPPAEQAYARGLHAPTIQLATVEYLRAIDLDYFYQPARSAACFGLFAQGRVQEATAVAESSAKIFPQSSEFAVFLSVAATLSGGQYPVTDARLKSALTPPQVDLLKFVQKIGSERKQKAAAPLWPGLADYVAILRLWRSAGGSATNRALAEGSPLRLPPAHQQQLQAYPTAFLFALTAPPVSNPLFGPPPTPEQLAANADALPEAFLLGSAADAFASRFNCNRNRPWAVCAADLLAAGTYFEKAADAPALFPEYRRHLLRNAAVMFATAGKSNIPDAIRDPKSSKRAAALLQRLLNEYGPSKADEAMALTKVAMNAGDPTLARRVVEDWARATPGDPVAHRWFAEVELLQESYGPAFARAEKALALIGHDTPSADTLRAEVVRVRDEAQSKLK